MDQIDTQRAVAYLRETWPTWKPTAEEVGVWTRQLAAFCPSLSAFEQAADAHWRDGQYGRPTPRAIFSQFKAAASNVSKPSPGDPGGHSGWWLKCLASEERPISNRASGIEVGRCRLRPGFFKELMFANDRQRDANMHRIADIAETERQRHEELYGGVWRVIREATIGEMIRGAVEPEQVEHAF